MEEMVDFRSSGSTGRPKCIRKTRASLLADADALFRTFGDSLLEDRPPFVASVQDDYIFGTLWRNLLPKRAGCAVYPATVLSAEELLHLRDRLGSFVFITTPSFLESLLPHPDAAGLSGAFRGIVSSGSLLRTDIALRAAEMFHVPVLEIFGSTETGSVAYRRQTEGPEWTVIDGVEVSFSESGGLVVDSPFCVERPFAMGDAAVPCGPRRFLYRGRLDRNVKILERYVFLPDVEAALERHPFVARAHAFASDGDVPRIWALVVPTPEGCSALRTGTYGAVIRTLQESTRATLPAIAVPRRIRFVPHFPTTTRGKLTRSLALACLRSRLQEPVCEDGHVAEDGAWLCRWTFPPDSVCFQGHFPSMPVLPGVAQLFFAERLLLRVHPDFPRPALPKRFKFQRVVRPSETLNVRLCRLSATKAEIRLSSGSAACATILFESPSP